MGIYDDESAGCTAVRSVGESSRAASGDVKVQDLANTAWAFTTASQQDAQLFAALARAAEPRLGDVNLQNLANTAWAFATSGMLAPTLLDPFLVLDAMEAQGTKPQVMCYEMAVAHLYPH